MHARSERLLAPSLINFIIEEGKTHWENKRDLYFRVYGITRTPNI